MWWGPACWHWNASGGGVFFSTTSRSWNSQHLLLCLARLQQPSGHRGRCGRHEPPPDTPPYHLYTDFHHQTHGPGETYLSSPRPPKWQQCLVTWRCASSSTMIWICTSLLPAQAQQCQCPADTGDGLPTSFRSLEHGQVGGALVHVVGIEVAATTITTVDGCGGVLVASEGLMLGNGLNYKFHTFLLK